MQLMFKVAKLLGDEAAGFRFKIDETHHTE
jgi:hypothetical protein